MGEADVDQEREPSGGPRPGECVFVRPDAIRARIAKRVAERGECRVWTGKTAKGYGRMMIRGREYQVHRVVYELEKGRIPEGLEIDHLCRNRACQRVEHLEPVTHRENDLRGISFSAVNARKTHCVRGHELTGRNIKTYPSAPGTRHCRACINALARERRRARGEERA